MSTRLAGAALVGLLAAITAGAHPAAAAAPTPARPQVHATAVATRTVTSTSFSVVVSACPLPTLRQGSTGTAVVQLQRLVHVSADGIFGPITRAAVISAQRGHGLAGTGVVDAATWRALGGTCGAVPATTRSRLDARIRAYLATRPSTVSVAVFDARTGASYTLGGGGSYDTASIVKVEVLGTLLRKAAREHRGLSSTEKSLASRMIRSSDNDATTQLWNRVGGGSAVGAFDRSVGMTQTVPGSGGYWGLTRTTAPDQLILLRNVAYSSSVLSAADRSYIRSLMGSVVSWQRWGVSGGVPSGVTVELKNGWLPRSTHAWRVHSIGHVRGQGRDYVLAVLSQDNSTMDTGVRTLEGVSSTVWRTLVDPLR